MTPELFEHCLKDFIVSYWIADEGKRESNGPNRADWIDQINTRLHVPLGSSYCIGALLVRGVEVVCTKFELVNPVVMTAGTQNFYQRALAKVPHLVIPKGKRAKKGSIGILQNKDDKSHGHAFGFRSDETDIQETIEYNTNPEGSRNGDGVYKLNRTQSGTKTKIYLGAVDVVAWIIEANKEHEMKDVR